MSGEPVFTGLRRIYSVSGHSAVLATGQNSCNDQLTRAPRLEARRAVYIQRAYVWPPLALGALRHLFSCECDSEDPARAARWKAYDNHSDNHFNRVIKAAVDGTPVTVGLEFLKRSSSERLSPMIITMISISIQRYLRNALNVRLTCVSD